nr:unnamed protein product [Callosobruchus analis]
MPTFYKRQRGSSRADWTEQQLKDAVEAVQNGMSLNEASKQFGIPWSTLKRRITNGCLTKKALGGPPVLTQECEKKMVKHIIKLQKFGFAPTRSEVRTMAYKLAEKCNQHHKFNREKETAGMDWLHLFLKRNSELSIRKSEGVSQARSKGLNKKIVSDYFSLQQNILIEHNLLDKPGNIFNVDESGLQLNNRPGYVLAAKGSKSVPAITSGEKGETISVIACCNGEGMFLPPVCVLKGKNEKAEYKDGMPSVFGRLFTKAWVQAATTENAISGFRSTGIVPFNPDVIPEYAFLMSAPDQQQDHNEQHENRPASPKPGCSHWQEISNPSEQATAEVDSDLALEHRHVSPELGYPQWTRNPQESMHTSSEATTVATKKSQMSPGQFLKHISPIPTLDKVASARKNSRALAEVLNSSVNIVNLRNKKRQIRSTASVKSGANAKRKIKAETITNVTTKGNTKKEQPKKRKASITDTESDSSLEIHLQDDDDDVDDVECCCVGCGELYNCTKKDVDWIKCISCQLWLHEDYSKYESMCDVCGKKQDK